MWKIFLRLGITDNRIISIKILLATKQNYLAYLANYSFIFWFVWSLTQWTFFLGFTPIEEKPLIIAIKPCLQWLKSFMEIFCEESQFFEKKLFYIKLTNYQEKYWIGYKNVLLIKIMKITTSFVENALLGINLHFKISNSCEFNCDIICWSPHKTNGQRKNLLPPIVHYLILSMDLYLMDLTWWVLKCFCSLQKLSRVWFTTDKMNFSKSPFSYHPSPILTSSTGQRCHWANFKSVWKDLHFYNFSLLQLLRYTCFKLH